jgi:Disaggregatase related repeat.
MTTYSSQPDGASGYDTVLSDSAATTNYGALQAIVVGERNDSAAKRRSLIKFDLSSIPSYSFVTSAKLYLTIETDFSSNSRDFKIYRALRDWVEMEATWNIWSTGNNWTTAGCGGNGTDADLTTAWATRTFSSSESGEVYWTFSATGIAELQKIISGTYTNYGWLIKADTETDDAYSFWSSDYATSTDRPKLVIEYTTGGQLILWTSE